MTCSRAYERIKQNDFQVDAHAPIQLSGFMFHEMLLLQTAFAIRHSYEHYFPCSLSPLPQA